MGLFSYIYVCEKKFVERNENMNKTMKKLLYILMK